MSSKITSLSKVVNQQALEAITQKLQGNVWAVKTRTLTPNADKLQDGAIQRQSVMHPVNMLSPQVNKEKVGYFKRAQLDETTSGSAYAMSNISEVRFMLGNRIARIYHNERKHVHCHPANKQIAKHWVVDFQIDSQYKSTLMNWTSATTDSYSKTKIHVGSLEGAINLCQNMGWGFDVVYPHQRWHTKKSYADNFLWKGKAQEEIK